MGNEQAVGEEKAALKKLRRESSQAAKRQAPSTAGGPPGLAGLQRQIGNRAVQRLLAQRSADAPSELEEDTAARINRERGGGQALDRAVQAQANAALGHDFSGVRVHTSPEANALSRELGATAFTTGRDVFFRDGAYDPHSTSGRQLITHELTHVVQQSGASASSGHMTVNPPGDAYERQADAVAGALAGAQGGNSVQTQAASEEEEVQTQPAPEEEEEEVQTQPAPEEEEVQMQAAGEEEEEEEVS